MKAKKESPAVKQGQSFSQHKGSKTLRDRKQINATDTQRLSFAQSTQLRQTEQHLLRLYFETYPDRRVCRADLLEAFDPFHKPINHITRMVYDAIGRGLIEVKGKGINPRTGRSVEYLGLRKEAHNG